ncbi:MAG: class II fructose-bisphosphate aldolase [Nitrospira sp.]|nr:aldolase [Candidatus Manganitrophaceae bacterium]HIL35401.1 aldolase [Candidatus Manganitrophaceae bacterium]
MFFQTMSQLGDTLKGIIEISDRKISVIDASRVRGALIDRLVWTAVFHEKDEMRGTARWIIKMAAPHLGIHLSSIQPLYEARGRGENSGFTVPAINVRVMAYDTARAIFRAASHGEVGAFILEIAKSEMNYTHQSPAEYAAVMTAAAIQEGFTGPLFIQGDHIQVSAKKYTADRETELGGIRQLIKEAITAGFYNIDIDSSTLVVLDRPNIIEQQRDNFEVAADLTAYIRSLEPAGVTISVGGEIGEVGGKNSTVEEFEVYLDQFLESLQRQGSKLTGISKISVQTGTSHGGVPLADGTVAEVKLDFSVLKEISKVAQVKYGLSGAVQHGASTLPAEVFDRFPTTGTAEIHLATEFQNMIYDRIPRVLREEIYTYLRETCKGERTSDQTEEQFIYKTRKKAIGPFKRRLWELPSDLREKIGRSLEERFVFLFNKLNVVKTRDVVAKTVQPVAVSFTIRDEIAAAEAESRKASGPQVQKDINPLAD